MKHVARLPKPQNPVEEKKQYILLMLLDTYEAHAGDVDATTFASLMVSEELQESFAFDVDAMFGLTPQPLEPISALVDRIYAAQHETVLTAKEFVE